MNRVIFLLTALAFSTLGARSEDADEIAKKLSNPVAAMISVPFQFNADFGAGPDGKGESYSLKVEPVIPFRLNEDWNLISRTIIPVAGNVGFPGDDVWGLGDISQSMFFTPGGSKPGDLIWGVGPIFLLPTATDDQLGSGKWGAGPTVLVLRQTDPWTVGMLASQAWSFAGDSDRADINLTSLQPFLAYALGGGQTLSFNTETTYDWTAEQWTVPINAMYSRVFHIGAQAMSWQIGARYYAEKPEGGPDWGVRAGITFIIPEK